MSIALVAAYPAGLLATTTVRRFGQALAAAGLAIAAGCGIYAVEKYALAADHRFVENPSDVMMRAFALAHFLLGWLFLFSSPRIRSPRSLGQIAVAAGAGVALCLLFASQGGTRNPVLIILFWGYFLVHEVRDECDLYRIYGDAPTLDGERGRFLDGLRWTATLSFMALLALAYWLYAATSGKRTTLEQLPTAIPAGIAGILLFVAGIAWLRLRSFGNLLEGDWKLALARHAPLLVVYGGIAAVLLLGTPFGSTGFNLIILLHVTAWMVFIAHQLAKRRTSGRGVWHWLRYTPLGFLTLHVGIAAVVLVLMAIRVHLWGKVGFLSQLFAGSNFVYWGLMHISIAFAKCR